MITKIGHYEIDDKTHAVEVFIPPAEKYLVSSQEEFSKATEGAWMNGKGFSTKVVHLDGV